MKHLVLCVKDGYVNFRMGDQDGSHPIGDDTASYVIDYLIAMIKPNSYEII